MEAGRYDQEGRKFFWRGRNRAFHSFFMSNLRCETSGNKRAGHHQRIVVVTYTARTAHTMPHASLHHDIHDDMHHRRHACRCRYRCGGILPGARLREREHLRAQQQDDERWSVHNQQRQPSFLRKIRHPLFWERILRCVFPAHPNCLRRCLLENDGRGSPPAGHCGSI